MTDRIRTVTDEEGARDNPPAVFAQDLSVSYGGVGSILRRRRQPVLREASIRVQAGEVVGLVGPNGAGKTTFFKTLLGFMRAQSGKCLVGGEDPGQYRRRRGVGYVPESVVLPRGWRARDLLCCAVDLSVPLDEREEAYAQAVARAGLESDPAALSRKATKCSNGVQRRIWMACALAGDPEIVLLDEPFAGLDPPARRGLRLSVRSARARGAAVLVASHELAEVARIADKVVLLRKGVTETVQAIDRADNDAVAAMEAAIFQADA